MKWRDDELEQYSRRNSLRISGVQEDDPRFTDHIVMDIAKKYDIDVEFKDIDRSHHVGNKTDGKNRAILPHTGQNELSWKRNRTCKMICTLTRI